MLYFTISPDSDNTAATPSFTELYLRVTKSTDIDEKTIYDHEHGVCRIFFNFKIPKKWQQETEDISASNKGMQRYCGTEEGVLLERALFYQPSEYNIEFLKARFADDLNTIMGRLEPFDQGIIWLSLVGINTVLAKLDNHTPGISEKEIGRVTRAVGSIMHNTERAIGLVAKLLRAAHITAENCPSTIHDIRNFTIRKAYLYYSYLFLLPLKEFLADKVLPRGRMNGFTDYLLDCDSSINLHSFSSEYDLLYGEEEPDKLLDKLIKSPGH